MSEVWVAGTAVGLLAVSGGGPAEIANRADRLKRLAEIAGQLGNDELAVLLSVAEGTLAGRRVYGELNVQADRRDFIKEAVEELRDATVYLTAQLLREQQVRRKLETVMADWEAGESDANRGRRG